MHPETLALLEAQARSALGNDFRVAGVERISGGDTNAAVRLRGGSSSVFVKLRAEADLPLFTAEAQSLAALSACTALRVPGVVAQGLAAGQSFLMLEWLDLHPLRDEAEAARAAEALCALHAVRGSRFGWEQDNFIGPTPQANAWHDNWSRFVVTQRLQPQFALARQQGYTGGLQRDGERLCERLPALFLDYRPAPSLLHGDLWHGNVGALSDGTPVLFDPACHYGDHEADLAMTELFGGFPLSFYATYRRTTPLAEGHELRRTLYNLYHVLNHLNLFGRGYLNQAERMTSQLAAALMR